MPARGVLIGEDGGAAQPANQTLAIQKAMEERA